MFFSKALLDASISCHSYAKIWFQNSIIAIKLSYNFKSVVKGLVHVLMKMSWSFTHPHVIQDVYVFLSSVEKKWRFLMKTFQDLCPYSELQ